MIYHVPPNALGLFLEHWRDIVFTDVIRNVINHAPTIYMNKFNKKPVLTTHTADICRRIAVR